MPRKPPGWVLRLGQRRDCPASGPALSLSLGPARPYLAGHHFGPLHWQAPSPLSGSSASIRALRRPFTLGGTHPA
eukprot:3504301-Rhodomonas_salina.1